MKAGNHQKLPYHHGMVVHRNEGSMAPKLVCIVATATVFGGLHIVFAYHGYPVPGMDSSVFIPLAINVAAGKGMINDVHPFLYPAPLFPMFLGAVMQEATPQGAFRVLGVLGAVNVMLSALLFYKVFKLASELITWRGTLVVCVFIAGMSACFSYHFCRPELLAFTFIIAICLLNISWPVRWSSLYVWILNGLGLGLVAATQPNAALLVGLVLVMWSAVKLEKETLPLCALVLLGTLSISVYAFVLVSPYSIETFLNRTVDVSEYLFVNNFKIVPDYSLVADYYVWGRYSPHIPALGFTILLAIGAVAMLWRAGAIQIKNPWLFAGSALLLVSAAYMTAVVYPNRNYNVLSLLPVALSVVAFAISRQFSNKVRFNSFTVVAVALVAVMPVNMIRNSMLLPHYAQRGISLEEVRAFASSIQSRGGEMLVSKSLWVVTEDYRNVRVNHDLLQEIIGREANEEMRVSGDPGAPTWLLIQQKDSGRSAPWAQIEGYVLVQHAFISEKPRLLGVKLANTWPGYSSALYARKFEGEAVLADP